MLPIDFARFDCRNRFEKKATKGQFTRQRISRKKIKDLESFDSKSLIYLVRLAGIEPTTPWFVAKYSIQLSYSRLMSDYNVVNRTRIIVSQSLAAKRPMLTFIQLFSSQKSNLNSFVLKVWPVFIEFGPAWNTPKGSPCVTVEAVQKEDPTLILTKKCCEPLNMTWKNWSRS